MNHIDDWDPNYSLRKEHVRIEPVADADEATMVAEARRKLGLDEPPKSAFRPDPATLQLFYELRTYAIDRPTGNVIVETTRPRPVLRELNDLHLNNLKGAWTIVADIYAASLVVVALTGLFVLKGRVGLGGRGKWFVALGTLIPLAALAWYKLMQ